MKMLYLLSFDLRSYLDLHLGLTLRNGSLLICFKIKNVSGQIEQWLALLLRVSLGGSSDPAMPRDTRAYIRTPPIKWVAHGRSSLFSCWLTRGRWRDRLLGDHWERTYWEGCWSPGLQTKEEDQVPNTNSLRQRPKTTKKATKRRSFVEMLAGRYQLTSAGEKVWTISELLAALWGIAHQNQGPAAPGNREVSPAVRTWNGGERWRTTLGRPTRSTLSLEDTRLFFF